MTTPEVSAIRDADRVIGLLEAAELQRPRLIINRINAGMVKRGDMMDQRDVVDLLAVDILGLVPADDRTVTAANPWACRWYTTRRHLQGPHFFASPPGLMETTCR